jgi:hypothetical protein
VTSDDGADDDDDADPSEGEQLQDCSKSLFGWTARLAGRQTGRRAGRQADRQAGRQAGRHSCANMTHNNLKCVETNLAF